MIQRSSMLLFRMQALQDGQRELVRFPGFTYTKRNFAYIGRIQLSESSQYL
jgi:hypothetical protein